MTAQNKSNIHWRLLCIYAIGDNPKIWPPGIFFTYGMVVDISDTDNKVTINIQLNEYGAR